MILNFNRAKEQKELSQNQLKLLEAGNCQDSCRDFIEYM